MNPEGKDKGGNMKTKMAPTLLMTLTLLFTSPLAFTDTQSLYDRIGGEPKARAIVEDIWNNHSANPIVKDRFANSDPVYVKKMVFEIFAAATGATDVKYTGKDMKSAHAGMNISEMEFNAVVDDVLKACESNGLSQDEQNEILAILWSVRKEIVNSNILTDTLVTEQNQVEDTYVPEQIPEDVDCLESLKC
ncbi:MAG: group 1 truncated hemoglobin [Pseudomonadota bacterium]